MSGIKKITFKKMNILSDDLKKAASKGQKAVCLVAGTVTGSTDEETQYGDYVDFRGEFEAINLFTAEQFGSYRMILPKYAEEVLAAKFKASDGAYEFKIKIGVAPSDKAPVGYEYTVELVQENISPAKSLLAEFIAAENPSPSNKKETAKA